jgi:hypothetical protein
LRDFIKFLSVIVGISFVSALIASGIHAVSDKLSSRETTVAIQPIYNDPELVASKDGCDTYRFYGDDGHLHYYTKCPHATVTHDNSWDERVQHGKFSELEHRSESITTDSK